MTGKRFLFHALHTILLASLWLHGSAARLRTSDDVLQPMEWSRRSRGLLQTKIGEKIAAGTKALCGRFPYMISLRSVNDEHACGGVLIGAEWVLTAAHCVDEASGLNPNVIIVVGGCNQNDKKGTTDFGRTVELFRNRETIIHENWTGSAQDGFDIALVRLQGTSVNTPVAYDTMAESFEAGHSVAAAGWGREEDGTLAEDLLFTDKLSVLANSYCSSDENGWGDKIQDSMVCAFGFGDGADTCVGDSGGPLLLPFAPGGKVNEGFPELDLVVGITSFGEKKDCGKSVLPGVYTRVSSFADWIQRKMGGPQDPPTDPVAPTLVEPPSSPLPNDTETPSSEEFAVASSPPPASEDTLLVSPTTSTTSPLNEGCACSEDGVIGGTQTGLAGCGRRLPDGILLCYLATTQDCETEFESVLVPGAFWAPCEDDQGVQELLQETGLSEEEQEKVSKELADLAGSSNSTATEARDVILRGADPGYRWVGAPVLHVAAGAGNMVVTSVLVESGADVNATDDLGWTALHEAAAFGRAEVVEFLVAVGSDTTARDQTRQTPLHVTCSLVEFCSGDVTNRMELVL